MAKPVENMVLRTVYLPKTLDNLLRDLANRAALSKGEFMRVLVQEALERRKADGRLTDPKAAVQSPSQPVKAVSKGTAHGSEVVKPRARARELA